MKQLGKRPARGIYPDAYAAAAVGGGGGIASDMQSGVYTDIGISPYRGWWRRCPVAGGAFLPAAMSVFGRFSVDFRGGNRRSAVLYHDSFRVLCESIRQILSTVTMLV